MLGNVFHLSTKVEINVCVSNSQTGVWCLLNGRWVWDLSQQARFMPTMNPPIATVDSREIWNGLCCGSGSCQSGLRGSLCLTSLAFGRYNSNQLSPGYASQWPYLPCHLRIRVLKHQDQREVLGELYLECVWIYLVFGVVYLVFYMRHISYSGWWILHLA